MSRTHVDESTGNNGPGDDGLQDRGPASSLCRAPRAGRTTRAPGRAPARCAPGPRLSRGAGARRGPGGGVTTTRVVATHRRGIPGRPAGRGVRPSAAAAAADGRQKQASQETTILSVISSRGSLHLEARKDGELDGAGGDGRARLDPRRHDDHEHDGLLRLDAARDEIARGRARRERQVHGIDERGPGGDRRRAVDEEDACVGLGRRAGRPDVDVDLRDREGQRVRGHRVREVDGVNDPRGVALDHRDEVVVLQDVERVREARGRLGEAPHRRGVAADVDVDVRRPRGRDHRVPLLRVADARRGGGAGQRRDRAGRRAEVRRIGVRRERHVDVEDVRATSAAAEDRGHRHEGNNSMTVHARKLSPAASPTRPRLGRAALRCAPARSKRRAR